MSGLAVPPRWHRTGCVPKRAWLEQILDTRSPLTACARSTRRHALRMQRTERLLFPPGSTLDAGAHLAERCAWRGVRCHIANVVHTGIFASTAASWLWLAGTREGPDSCDAAAVFLQCPLVLHHPFPIAFGLPTTMVRGGSRGPRPYRDEFRRRLAEDSTLVIWSGGLWQRIRRWPQDLAQTTPHRDASNRVITRLADLPYAQRVCYQCVDDWHGTCQFGSVGTVYWRWECVVCQEDFTKSHWASDKHKKAIGRLTHR